MNDIDVLTGSTQRHLTDLCAGQADAVMLVHQDIVAPLTELQQNAAAAGFGPSCLHRRAGVGGHP